MTSWTFLFIKCDALPWYRVTALNSFTSAALGNIVFSHYSSSLDHPSRSMPLWSPAAHVFGCTGEPTARCPSFNRNIETASWLFRGKRIKRRSLYELLVRWSGLAPKALIKQQRGMNGWCGVLFPAVSVEYSQCPGGWRGTNDPCPVAIHLLLSFLLWNAANYLHAALILMKAVRGFYGEPRPVPRGANDLPFSCLLMILPPTGGIGEASHLSILFPGVVRPCLFISIRSICGTAAVGRGCRWQRLVRAFPWQRCSWQAGERVTHTWLINTNNETANQE